jgi:hypothetical protein
MRNVKRRKRSERKKMGSNKKARSIRLDLAAVKQDASERTKKRRAEREEKKSA